MTVKTYLLQWFEVHKKTIEPATVAGYTNNTNKHIIPALGNTRLSALTKQQITAFYAYLSEEKKLSPASIKYVNSVLRKALKDAVEDGLINRNPCESAKRPKETRYHATVLDTEQIKALIKGCIGNDYETEILAAVCLGLRRGEVLGLRFGDFDFEKETVHIQQQVTDSKQKLQMGCEYMDLDLVCCNKDGSIISPQTLYHGFKKLMKDLELPDIRFHDLRHSYATVMADQDVPLKMISQALGHSTIAITGDIYCDVLEKRKKTMADILQNTIVDDINTK